MLSSRLFSATRLVAFIAAVLVAVTVHAQSTTGTIAGRVSDPQGLPVPGATVVATSPNLQGAREAVTSTSGEYIFALLPPGTYTLAFELSGFGKVERSVTLSPTQRLPLDVTLDPAGVTETVQVVGTTATCWPRPPRSR